jgi:thioredoxin 1
MKNLPKKTTMNLSDIQTIITNKPAVFLYFFNDNCAPCKILRPKVQEMVATHFDKLEFHLVNAEKFAETAAHFGIFSSPTLLVFFEGKEYIRESKNISINELHDKINRYYKMIF